jgi:hypothetical protein
MARPMQSSHAMMHLTPPSLRHTLSSSIPWLLALSFGALSHVGLWFAAEPRIHVVPVPPVPIVVTAPAACPSERPTDPSATSVEPRPVIEREVGMLEPLVDVRDVVQCPEENLCRIDRALAEALIVQRSVRAWAPRVVPSIRDGEVFGVKLYGVRQGTLTAALGLRNGDLVRSIDGRPLTGMDEAMAVYTSLRQATSFELEVLREDERIIKRYQIE